MKDKAWKLLFGVRRSVRYHSRRCAFFDRFHLATSSAGLIFGSATIFAVLSSIGLGYAVGFAAIVTVFSAVDLVVGTSQMARLHEALMRRFIALEKKMISFKETDLTEDVLAEMWRERLGIESDEPAVYRVLDTLCHNELARAEGYGRKEMIPVKWYQRLFAQLFDIQEHKLGTHA